MTRPHLLSGIDRLADGDRSLQSSARYGLVTNRAARTADGRTVMEVMRRLGFDVAALFAPEHGFESAAPAGQPIPHSSTGEVPIYSLYGADRGPAEEMMLALDALVLDLPDVGARYYTYGWTLREVLKMAATFSKPITVLDRPNPLNGTTVEGNIPEPGFDSPVCASNVPVRHGLTLGELARWQERHLGLENLDLEVLTVRGWRREMNWACTRLTWVPPSPALLTAEAAALYPGTCLIEGTSLSEGRGTEMPFQQFGAPLLDGSMLAEVLRGQQGADGVSFTPVTFTPRSSKWTGQLCNGVRIHVRNLSEVKPVQLGIAIIGAALELSDVAIQTRQFDALAGTAKWREALLAGTESTKIAASWQLDEQHFLSDREEVLLYG